MMIVTPAIFTSSFLKELASPENVIIILPKSIKYYTTIGMPVYEFGRMRPSKNKEVTKNCD
jgi:hypothetical protein